MATLDDSPSLFSGQQWTDWAESVLPDNESDAELSDTAEDVTDTDSMKLKLEDMPLFGICPSRDEFYLVVCDMCHQVLKPQVFQTHIDIRHGGKGGYTMSKTHQSSRHSVSSKSHSKSHSTSKSHRSSHSKSHSSPNKSSHRTHAHSQLRPHNSDLVNSGPEILSHVAKIHSRVEDVKVTTPTKASVKEPPLSLETATKVGADLIADLVKDSKLQDTNTIPVVKVERMPETLALKKQRESSGSARTSPMTNGAVRASKSPISMPVITDTLEDIEPSITSMPALNTPQEAVNLYMEDMDTVPVSEINDAVSSILESVSPDSEPEAGGFVALATSSSTITTNTVTMASVTTSTTTVTNVINTSSSFTFGSMGRPSPFPMGSIRVNFSSTGVLSTITGDGNNNNPNNVTKTSSVTSDSSNSRTTICSNGSMESTISDIVKSAVNSGNTGGFKSLSPLLTSPNKSNGLGNITSSFKSPSKLANLVKSASSSNLSKTCSKLGSGTTSVLKPSSFGSVTSTSDGSSSSTVVAAANTEAIKKFQLLHKPDKIIPLKDREYDANKHCGVIVSETCKPCTRSLTCKSHALSLRRAVTGRRLSFDDLLKEHREAKEAYLKAKVESKEATAALKAAHVGTKGSPHSKFHNLGNIPSALVKSPTHLNQILNKENKSMSVPVFSLSKPPTLHKSASISSHRLSLSSIGSPSSSDELQSPTGKSGDKPCEEIDDNSFTSYHPRPIAACSFGARYHNNYGSGFGCYTFGRRTDHLRATFLDLLEKHANPPPPKKLCVEANLPREQDSIQTNADPYEFGFMDANRNLIGQHVIQAPAGLITSAVPNKVLSKQKVKSAIVSSNHAAISGSKPKLKEGFVLTNATSICGSVTPALLAASSSAKKRRSSGSAGSHSTINPSSLGASLVTAPSILASVGALSNSTAQQQQFAIAIPSVNISGAALSQIGASLVAGGNLKHANKNNVIKDTMGFVVTGISQEALLNGQIVNITNSQLTSDLTSTQIQTASQEEGIKAVQQINVITSKHVHQQPKFINSSIDAIRALQAGKGNLITGLPPNAVLLDSSLQPGAVLQPVTLTTSSGTPVMSINSTLLTQHQQHQNQNANASQFIRSSSDGHHVSTSDGHHVSTSDGHHVSTSPLPNGVVTNAVDKELLMSQCHTVFQPKGVSQSVFQSKGVSQSALQQQTRGTIQQASHIFTGAHLHNQNFTFQTPSSSNLTNQISANASPVLPSQLAQLQLKNSSLHKTGPFNKLNMQPVSITIPFVTQNNLGGVEIGGQQHGHTLFITSEDAQKQGIHLQPKDQPTQNSPSSLIS